MYAYNTPNHYLDANRFRMPRARGEVVKADAPRKPVVLLQHALLDSSFAFVLNSPSQSLGFLLADAGCDCVRHLLLMYITHTCV